MAMATFATSLRRSALSQQIARFLSREGWKANPSCNRITDPMAAPSSWERELDGRPASVSLVAGSTPLQRRDRATRAIGMGAGG